MLARGLYTCIPDVLLGWVLHSPIRHFSLGAVFFPGSWYALGQSITFITFRVVIHYRT